MALFKVCARTLTGRIATQRIATPAALLTIRRNFGVKDNLDKYRDDSNAAFEDGMDAFSRETSKLQKKPYDPADSFSTHPDHDVQQDQLNTEGIEKFEKDTGDANSIADVKKFVDSKFETKEGEAEEFIFDMGSMETKDDMTSDEARQVAEEVYRSWPKDNTLPIDEALPYAEKMKAADLDGSYGPAKAEFDSWKRIYKEEEAFERLGLPPRAHYWRDGEMYAPYGTLSNPVKIYSQFNNRIVGCRGGNGVPHEVVWINLGNKYKTMCPECGQVFMLVNYQPKEHEEPGEELHTISRTQNDGHLKEPQLY